jgi:ethanolamine utilization protein EutA
MVMTEGQIQTLAGELADCVLGAIPGSGIVGNGGLRTEPLRTGGLPAAVNFSGGVSEYVYGREQRAFDDLGPALGNAVAARVRALGVPSLPPTTGIRATVLGVSQYAVQVSGSTVAVPSTGLLPLRNVPVAGPPIVIGESVDQAGITSAIHSGLGLLKQPGPTALALRWAGSPTWERLDAVGHAILAGVQPVLAAGHPVVLVFDQDVSQLVGKHFELEMDVSADLICIDCVELRQFDYIDVGAPLAGAAAVPVVIKSLVFGGASDEPPTGINSTVLVN